LHDFYLSQPRYSNEGSRCIVGDRLDFNRRVRSLGCWSTDSTCFASNASFSHRDETYDEDGVARHSEFSDISSTLGPGQFLTSDIMIPARSIEAHPELLLALSVFRDRSQQPKLLSCEAIGLTTPRCSICRLIMDRLPWHHSTQWRVSRDQEEVPVSFALPKALYDFVDLISDHVTGALERALMKIDHPAHVVQ